MAKKSKSVEGNKALIYILGESPMVEEYAEVCSNHGYDVIVAWNSKPSSKPDLKSGVKVSDSIPKHCSLGIELTNTDLAAKRKNLEKLDQNLPATSAILSSSVAVAATEQAGWIKSRHRLVGLSALPSLAQRPMVEVAPTVFSPKETLEVVTTFFASLNMQTEIVQDRVGMVLPRILCQLINEAAFALMEDVASPRDIDTAMKLGVNYPLGPIEWAEKIGMKQVFAVLDALHNDLREERYRPCPLLKQMAESGEWWKRN